ncbi:unnamed protein product [Nezara viridula]|uniref:Uncharacterized protein n=1 Tax=Nezara viridula TaxID=85310 RepID=A0A9P0HUB1_NEZVI|nr:unnamed protein product [Nezara viridula]
MKIVSMGQQTVEGVSLGQETGKGVRENRTRISCNFYYTICDRDNIRSNALRPRIPIDDLDDALARRRRGYPGSGCHR